MKKQIYILKDVESGSFDDVTTDNFYLLVDDSEDAPSGGNFIPLSGTEVGSPVTGDIVFYNAIEDENLGWIGSLDGMEIALIDRDELAYSTPNGIYLRDIDVIVNFVLDNKGASIAGNTPLFKGFYGTSYYGANYDDNTYVQKKYVDEAIAGSGVINIKATLVDAAYTLQNSDVNFVIPTTNVATVITVNDDSITRVGDVIYVDYQGDGTCEIKEGTATLTFNENDTLFLDGKYSRVAIQKMSATNYRVFGQLIPA